MSKYDDLKRIIDDNIKSNDNNEITGPITNTVLKSMVDTLMPPAGKGYFRGVIKRDSYPASDTEIGDYYLAVEPGEYEHFGPVSVDYGDVAIISKEGPYIVYPFGLTRYESIERCNLVDSNKLVDAYYDKSGNLVSNVDYSALFTPIPVQPKCRYIIRSNSGGGVANIALLDSGYRVKRVLSNITQHNAFTIDTLNDEVYMKVSGKKVDATLGVFFGAVLDNPKQGKPQPWTGIVGEKLLFSTDGNTPTFGIFTPAADSMSICTTNEDGDQQSVIAIFTEDRVTVPVRASFPLGLEQSQAYVGDINDLVQEGIYYCDSNAGTTNLPEGVTICSVSVRPVSTDRVVQHIDGGGYQYHRTIPKTGGTSEIWNTIRTAGQVMKAFPWDSKKIVNDVTSKELSLADAGTYGYYQDPHAAVIAHFVSYSENAQIMFHYYPTPTYIAVRTSNKGTWTDWVKLQTQSAYTAELATHTAPATFSAAPATAGAGQASSTLTDEELKAISLRYERDDLLRATDKFAVADYPFASDTEKKEVFDYRKALRELPQLPDFPNVELPTPPASLIIKKAQL